MLTRILLRSLHTLQRTRSRSALSAAALVVGLACFFALLCTTGARDLDRFARDGDAAYRVMRHTRYGNNIETSSSLPVHVDEGPERRRPTTDAIPSVHKTSDPSLPPLLRRRATPSKASGCTL